MYLTGRQQILTSYSPYPDASSKGLIMITPQNMHEALQEVLPFHAENAKECDTLLQYYKGEQSILTRNKVVREDVNNKVVLNYALSTTRDIVGYTFGKPITLTQRKTEYRKDIQKLNDFMASADKSSSDQEKATTASICGISYRGIFPDSVLSDSDEVPFTYVSLDPRRTFVAYVTSLGNPPSFGVTYNLIKGDDGDTYTIYHVYTPFAEYLYKVKGNMSIPEYTDLMEGYPKPHILGEVPIVENINNQFRMGHWEMAVSVFDSLNLIVSDSVNDIEQFVNSILVAINAELDEETMEQVKTNKFVSLIAPSGSGMQVDLKYIAKQLDSNGVEVLRQYLEEAYRAIVGVPDRKTRGGGGGDTGDAVKLRDGWANMEIVARTTEMFFTKSEKQELRIILNILKSLNQINKKLTVKDLDVKFTRNKTDNLQTKVQALATLHAMQLIDPVDAVSLVDITTDVSEMVDRGQKYWDNKLKSVTTQDNPVSINEGNDTVTQERDE